MNSGDINTGFGNSGSILDGRGVNTGIGNAGHANTGFGGIGDTGQVNSGYLNQVPSHGGPVSGIGNNVHGGLLNGDVSGFFNTVSGGSAFNTTVSGIFNTAVPDPKGLGLISGFVSGTANNGSFLVGPFDALSALANLG